MQNSTPVSRLFGLSLCQWRQINLLLLSNKVCAHFKDLKALLPICRNQGMLMSHYGMNQTKKFVRDLKY